MNRFVCWRGRFACCHLLVLGGLLWIGCAVALPSVARPQAKRPFTVRDDISFTHFANGSYGNYAGDAIQFSPNGEYFCAVTSRGRLEINQVEESLSFYRTADVEGFLKHSGESQPPSPAWVVTRSGRQEPIQTMRWLADSSGVALLEKAENGNEQVVVASLEKKTTETVTPDSEDVKTFDASDQRDYVYVSSDPEAFRKKVQANETASALIATGRSVWDLLFPFEPQRLRGESPTSFWAVVAGKRIEVANKDIDTTHMALSPDGHTIITTLPVTPPTAWQTLYPPPYKAARFDNLREGRPARRYVLLNLKSGEVQELTDAPMGFDAGWQSGWGSRPSWSSDGQAVLLPATFLKSNDNSPSRPCIAVLDLSSNSRACVEILKSRTKAGGEFEKGYHSILGTRFAAGDQNRVEVRFLEPDESLGTIEYRRASNGAWQSEGESKGSEYKAGRRDLAITVKEWMDQPPVLVASNKETSHVILDPNPQFQDVELGGVEAYTWKDKEGREWRGGLYKPSNPKAVRPYPLVIQTHGFSESVFLPSGSFPTAFAARELAAAGIAVLQVGGSTICGAGVGEASCEVEGFESAARQLAADAIIDIHQVGYIGFSRSCWYGSEMLTSGSLPLKAALLADGYIPSYLLFALFGADQKGELGANPIGEGFQEWVKRAPGFHLDKITAPVMLVGERDGIDMWEPYMGLHYLGKPVDLIWLNTYEHVITNPAERLASQGLSVDWLRFWLQGYEDPDPAKAEQYKRWHGLREMQEAEETKQKSSQAVLH